VSFAVFIHRADSIYDDRPDQQYQFPRMYLSRVRDAVGDWIVYYEPTKVKGTRGYFAVAKVADVVADPSTPDRYLALIAPGTYLPFTMEIPFMLPGGPAESGLLNARGRLSGRAQAAVRPLSAEDFNRIVSLGLADGDTVLPRAGDEHAIDPNVSELDDNRQVPFEIERDRASFLLSRPIRDRVFRTLVLRAYDQRCAVTGFKFINGGGRAEVAAAHIRPVEANGPDDIRNGVALSGTAHWMFDRGLISFADDLTILISRHVNDRDGVVSLINPSGRLIGPAQVGQRPHPRFLSWHRENCFKT
jgi:putative restriction endonuclease